MACGDALIHKTLCVLLRESLHVGQEEHLEDHVWMIGRTPGLSLSLVEEDQVGTQLFSTIERPEWTQKVVLGDDPLIGRMSPAGIHARAPVLTSRGHVDLSLGRLRIGLPRICEDNQ